MGMRVCGERRRGKNEEREVGVGARGEVDGRWGRR